MPAFLQAASLTYESLLELLQVAWVQGGLNIAIQGIDDTCMTSKQVLAPFSASTTLASPITASQTSITVASDAGFPSPNFYISIGSEILLVTLSVVPATRLGQLCAANRPRRRPPLRVARP